MRPDRTACAIATVDTETRREWPFLFVGAGEASYFEWAEVHVLFASEPNEQMRAVIEDGVPPPLRDSIDWNGEHLMIASDQFAHVAIAEAYASDEDDVEEEDEVEEEGWFFAGDAQVARFNGAIEGWLHEANRICPILVAYRHEDGESGGTELSPWHEWSARQTDRLLPALEPILERGVEDAKAHAARGVLEMVRESGVFLPKRVQALLDPGAGIRAALDAGDAALLSSHVEARDDALEILHEELTIRKESHLIALLGALDAILQHEGPPDEIQHALVKAALLRPDDPNAPRAFELASARAQQDKSFADLLAYHAFQAIQSQQWLEAIAIFDLVIDSPDLDRTAYNNALYAIMADNNKMPLDRPRAERFLASALRFAPENPAIFFNAACLFLELGDTERTLAHLTLARKHGHPAPEAMRDEPLFAPIANDPRFVAIFEDL